MSDYGQHCTVAMASVKRRQRLLPGRHGCHTYHDNPWYKHWHFTNSSAGRENLAGRLLTYVQLDVILALSLSGASVIFHFPSPEIHRHFDGQEPYIAAIVGPFTKSASPVSEIW
eukprot:scaffold258276_cov18-Prasinocladus_malaysianus.AAC.1